MLKDHHWCRGAVGERVTSVCCWLAPHPHQSHHGVAVRGIWLGPSERRLEFKANSACVSVRHRWGRCPRPYLLIDDMSVKKIIMSSCGWKHLLNEYTVKVFFSPNGVFVQEGGLFLGLNLRANNKNRDINGRWYWLYSFYLWCRLYCLFFWLHSLNFFLSFPGSNNHFFPQH